jgi:ribonuclease HI
MFPLSQGLVEVINQSKGKPNGMIDGGRRGILGNPFDMQGNERLRKSVCEAHDEYFDRVYFGGEEPVAAAKAIAKERRLAIAPTWKHPSRDEYVALIDKIDAAVASGKQLQVGCYCAPALCHCNRLAEHWNRDRTKDQTQETSMNKQIVEVYADGGARPNPGKGGYGAVVVYADGSTFEMGGAKQQSTNNGMELRGTIAALTHLVECKATGEIAFKLDSEYVRKGIDSLPKWEANDWKSTQGIDVKNRALWQKLSQLLDRIDSNLSISFEHVEAHTGDRHNERCDAIATAFIQGRDPQLNQTQPAQPETTTDLKFPCYLSLVQGELAIHDVWDECKARSEFQAEAKTKKCKSMAEVETTLEAWKLSPDVLQDTLDRESDRHLEDWVEVAIEEEAIEKETSQLRNPAKLRIWTGEFARQEALKFLEKQQEQFKITSLSDTQFEI